MPARDLSAALIAAVSAKNLDGVNFDFEGEGSADQVGLTRLITQVSGALHAANPHWQVTMATYASAAGDSSGFYNIAALAPALDGFFVMAYDMNDRSAPSATAPLIGGGFNDTEALQQFTAVVPASKVILGVPYYGYDWPTTDGTQSGPGHRGRAPLSDGVIAASGHPTYWDPSTDTAWTSYQVGQPVARDVLRRPDLVGHEGPAGQLVPHRRPGHLGAGHGRERSGDAGGTARQRPGGQGLPGRADQHRLLGVVDHRPTGAGRSGFTTSGVWDGARVPLTPVAPPASDGSALYLGTLSRVDHDRPGTEPASRAGRR